MIKYTVIILFIIAGLAVIYFAYKSGNPIKSIIKSVFQGVISLMAVNVLGLMTGVTIAVNWYTLSCVCLFGLPSTITLVLLDTFLI